MLNILYPDLTRDPRNIPEFPDVYLEQSLCCLQLPAVSVLLQTNNLAVQSHVDSSHVTAVYVSHT